MLENAFSARLADLVEQCLWLYRRDSMPGFLAVLTLRLPADDAPDPPPRPVSWAAARPGALPPRGCSRTDRPPQGASRRRPMPVHPTAPPDDDSTPDFTFL